MISVLLIELGQWFRPYQYQVAMAIVATALVIFGSDINGAIRQLLRKKHFIVRSLIFVVICAFGYGLITVWLTQLLSSQLAAIPDKFIVPVVTAVFVLLGMWAQKHRHI